MEEVIEALRTLNYSTEASKREEADIFLREWQSKSTAWSTADAILRATELADEVHIFAAQTLRNKVMYDFVELPASYHEGLCETLLNHLNSYRSKGPTATILSLAIADFSVQAALVWSDPVRTLMQRYASETEGVRTLLLLLKHLPEENTNRRVMADEAARAAHEANIRAAALEVIKSLVDIMKSSTDPNIRGEALSCWLSWVYFDDTCVEQVDCMQLFEDCFSILSAAGEYSNSESHSYRVENIQELVTESIVTMLRHALSNPEQDLSKSITGVALKHSIATLSVPLRLSYENQDIEQLIYLSRAISYTGMAHIPAFLSSADTDVYLHSLLQILLNVSETPTKLEYLNSADGCQCGCDEELMLADVFRFWERLSSEVLKCHNNGGIQNGKIDSEIRRRRTPSSPSLPSSPNAVHTLKTFIKNFVAIAVSLCIPNRRNFNDVITVEFENFRTEVLDCLCNCVQVLGVTDIINQLLESIVNTLRNESTAVTTLEGHLGIFARLFQVMKGPPQECTQLLFQFIQHLEAFLQPTPAPNLSVAYVRAAALSFFRRLSICELNGHELIDKLIRLVYPQLLLPYTPPVDASPEMIREQHAFNDTTRKEYKRIMKEVHYHSAKFIYEICKDCKDVQHLYNSIEMLCTICRNNDGVISEEVTTIILNGMGCIIVKVEENDRFISLLNTLCGPMIEAIRSNSTNEAVVCKYLDRISVLLRETSERGEQQSDRLDALALFLIPTVWPIVEAFMLQYPQSEEIIERCCRTAKHCVKCIGLRSKAFMLRFIEIVIAGAQVKLHCTYLYVVEWMGKHFLNDQDIYPRLVELFYHLGTLALQDLESHKNHLHTCPEMVQDCYSMLSSFLRFYPEIATASPNLSYALILSRKACYVEHWGAADAVFSFLDNLILLSRLSRDDPDIPAGTVNEKDEMISSKVKLIVDEHFPLLVKEFFTIIASVPLFNIVENIELVLGDCVKASPVNAEKWIGNAFDVLPRAVFPTVSMSREYLNKFMRGEDELVDALQEIFTRCEQLMLRNQRRNQ